MEFTEETATALLSELTTLKCQIEQYIRKSKMTDQQAKDMIEYLNRRLGIDVNHSTRKSRFVTIRSIIYLYLRETQMFGWKRIANLFDVDHSTIIYSYKRAYFFRETKDLIFMSEYNSIMQLIEDFRK